MKAALLHMRHQEQSRLEYNLNNRIPGQRFHRIADADPETWTLFTHANAPKTGASCTITTMP